MSKLLCLYTTHYSALCIVGQDKTCVASSATPASLWTRLQGLLWCSSNCESGLEALVSIYAMIAIAMYCCPYFLSPLLVRSESDILQLAVEYQNTFWCLYTEHLEQSGV